CLSALRCVLGRLVRLLLGAIKRVGQSLEERLNRLQARVVGLDRLVARCAAPRVVVGQRVGVVLQRLLLQPRLRESLITAAENADERILGAGSSELCAAEERA